MKLGRSFNQNPEWRGHWSALSAAPVSGTRCDDCEEDGIIRIQWRARGTGEFAYSVTCFNTLVEVFGLIQAGLIRAGVAREGL